MEDKKEDSSLKARQYAFLLLKFRMRSEKELKARLEGKRFNAAVIFETLNFLKEKKFLDDAYFAKVWIEERVKKPLGLSRLKEELKLKGVDKRIIEKQIEEVRRNYSEEKEVSALLKQRLKRLKGLEPQKVRSRVYGFLLRRGFSPEVVNDAIQKLDINTDAHG